MKQAMRTFILMSMVLSMTTLCIVYAQESNVPGSLNKPQVNAVGNSDQYIIGPEDVLLIHVWREESLTRTVPVRIDGKISLPLVDDLQAAGLTPLQLKDVLTKKLKDFIENPTVTVTIMEPNSFKVYVSGEIKQPGVHQIRSDITLVKLIIKVGGFTDWADQKNILIITKENGKEKRLIANYKKIINGEQPDIVINRDDTIIVK